ncbi:Gfo/Idh/MocA family protein [Rheinheimera sp. MM224]|uniref:Gfo/Idh/MocA family protein n=1 Tax=Rheinheimera sp. MM224 TaxID=3019969 RepID=UPI0021F8DB73|nr:Gfo/Idh/MocA family oxidoreductase [Rheinheimera sp. MM224]CAI3796227.1 Inositol 2-dehydrogenase/D-chiro-inositol 3-dehydrogenase [Rheinheimera sp. MM224]
MKIVLVGLGSIGKRHLANLLLLWPQAKVYVVSASERSLSAVELVGQTQLSLEQAIAVQPLFAVIASPAHLHIKHAMAFRDAGIPALIEKPLSHQHQLAAEFLREQPSQPLFCLGYCLRYLPSAQVVKQLLTEQKLGPVYLVQAMVGQHLSQWRKQMDYRDSVSAKQAFGGGALLELSHELDYLLWLFGPLSVDYCRLARHGELMLDVEERADLMLSGDNSLLCQLHLDFLQQVPQRRCVISGQQGRIEWDLLENSVCLINADGQQQLYHQPFWDKNQMYLLMLQDFFTAVTEEKAAPVPLQDGLAVLRLVEQAKRMAENTD